MPVLMKDKYYNYDSLHDLASRIKAVFPSFQENDFVDHIMNETWDALELKARMRQITINLGKYLPADYKQALGIIDQVIAGYPSGYNDNALIYFPDFVEVYGQDECHWDLSMAAIERYTPLSTAEFAVRPFIIKQEARMMQQMAVWARHDNEHVRRLASEGCRPALPWGQALTSFKKDPSPVLPILEQLNTDPSLYVRKSVANHLNDISKTHPGLVKKGNQEVLDIFGYHNAGSVDIADFTLGSASISLGENMTFSFTVSAKETTKVRLEYAMGYVKADGRLSRKIFQISEILLKANQKKTYIKKHSFSDLRTRKHYPGTHSVTLIVNGAEQDTLDFELTI